MMQVSSGMRERGPGARERETTMDNLTTVEFDRTITTLPLQDALRTVGFGLEASRVRRARLMLNAARRGCCWTARALAPARSR